MRRETKTRSLREDGRLLFHNPVLSGLPVIRHLVLVNARRQGRIYPSMSAQTLSTNWR
jgi:hypothetical protein